MIIGIVAEYNPFHNGHKYQIDFLKENYNPDGIIIAMSGNYVQRGEMASFDKYLRAQSALLAGASLVFEIPQVFATASARDFARAGVKLLSSCGCDVIVCGVETLDNDSFRKITNILSNETEEYKNYLQDELKKGLTFPLARANAISRIYDDDSIAKFIGEPNNLLAIEYALAAKYFDLDLEIIPIKREKVGHHDTLISDNFASASYIRKTFSSGEDAKSLLPYPDLFNSNDFLELSDFDKLLFDRLLSLDNNYYYDIDSDLFNRIKNNIYNFTTTTEFIELIKTKNVTYTAVSRALTRILLDFSADDSKDYLPFVRLLGMKKEAKQLLSSVSSSLESVGELVTSMPKEPSPLLLKQFKNDALYEGIRALKSGTKIQNELKRKFLVVE